MNKNEQSILDRLPKDHGTLRLTKTMLEKSIIDANSSLRAFAYHFGVDFTEMEHGEKRFIDAAFEDGTECRLSFYRTVNRGDRRFSCSGLRKRADVGDLIALTRKTVRGKDVLVVNVTQSAAIRTLRKVGAA